MSTISGLNTSNIYSLLSSSQNSSQTSNSTASKSATVSQPASSSSNNLQDMVNLILTQSSESLIQSLFQPKSSQDFTSLLETSETLNAVTKTNLFASNPQLAEALLGETLPSSSLETTATSPDSTSQSTGSSGTAAATNLHRRPRRLQTLHLNLLDAIEQTNSSQTNTDQTQTILQILQSNNTDATSSNSLGSILDLIA